MHRSFERLFNQGTEEESGTPKSGIGSYGIMLYVRPMIEWTGLDLYQVLDMNIVEFFNLTLFNIDWNDFKEKQMKQMLKK